MDARVPGYAARVKGDAISILGGHRNMVCAGRMHVSASMYIRMQLCIYVYTYEPRSQQS
jgi:hypothetical protein